MFRHAFSMQHFRQRLAHTEALPQMILLGVLCGLICGIVLGTFRLLLELPAEHFFPSGKADDFESLPTWLKFSLPVIGSLLLIALLSRVSPLARKVGVIHLLERMAYHQSNLPLKNAVIQFFAACIALIFGHSVGKEGPAVHLGAACGSQLGLGLKLPNNTLRILAGCGCAAGIAATFNTPLAGVIFAMEVVLLEYTVIGFMPVIVSAATGALVVQFLFGRELALKVPAMDIQSLLEIPYVAFLGCMIGLLAVLFIFIMSRTLEWSKKTNLDYKPKLIIAGVLTGACAIFYPQVMGIGYDTISAVMAADLSLQLLLGILLAKCILTPVVLGLGVPAGLIAPTFFIGALAGGILGALGADNVDHDVAHAGFYAMLGMCSMMGAVVNAPMAALVAILELTGNPNIIFPAMIAIVLSNVIARYVFKMPSMFVISMQIQGMDYRYQPLNQVLNRSAVGSLMSTDFIQVESILTLTKAQQALTQNPAWFIIDSSKGYLLLSPGDLNTMVQQLSSEQEDIDLLNMPALRLDTADIDEKATLQEALDTMTAKNVEALCIRNDKRHICGLLTRNQIEQHYRQN